MGPVHNTKLSEILMDHKTGLCLRNLLVNTMKGQFPSTGPARQKDTVVETSVRWHWGKVAHLGYEGVVQCTPYQRLALWTAERGYGRSWPPEPIVLVL